MKLYTTAASPFGARVRIQVYKKKLPVDIVAPPEADELHQINPLRKFPVLQADDQFIVESEVIQEYLQENYPRPSLLGDTAESSATIRTLSRITDLYLLPALLPIRSYLKADLKDEKSLDEGLKALHEVFATMEHFIDGDTYAVSARLSLADCSMAPMFLYLHHFSTILDLALPLGDFPRLRNWSEKIRDDETVNRVMEEMETALR